MECHVCQTIIEIYSAEFEEPDEEFLGEVSAVLNMNCPHAESFQRAANFDRHISDFPNEQLAIQKMPNKTAIRLGLATSTPQDDIEFYNISSTWMDLMARDDRPDHPGRAILPNSKWIDLDVVRNWMSICKNEHQGKCHEPIWLRGVAHATPDWFIDVVQDCIVVAPGSRASFVALSYTWGLGRNLKHTKATSTELQRPGALRLAKFATQLPETIRNTIDLVRALGQRYLWVDALCIVQDDPISLDRNLNQMQLIYANSVFCIMAATGCGAEFGLRGLQGLGLSPPRDLDLRVYELADGEKLVAKSLSQDPTAGTKYSYSQRGWTFQEWLFSRRRLVFDHGPLEWQCQCAKWQEDLKANREADNIWALTQKPREFNMDPSPSIWDFMEMASTFNTKALTMQEDAPRAFAGIQAMLHRVHPGGLLYGLSEFFFEVSMAWSSLYSDIERRQSSGPEEQNGLPSWSWLGWQGDITFPNDGEFQQLKAWHRHEQKIGFIEPVTEWFTMPSPSSKARRRIRSEWHKFKIGAKKGTLPTGWTKQRYDHQTNDESFFFPQNEPEEVFVHHFKTNNMFKYPVPVLKWADTPILSEQTQYLAAETCRAHFSTMDMTAFPVAESKRRICFKDSRQRKILSLTLQNAETAWGLLQARPKMMELIPFAKGWSTWLGDDFEGTGWL